MFRTRSYSGSDTYRLGNAYFICDRCSQRWRRSQMRVEWDNLRVCKPCLDPRPPQMQPPDVFPEGIPFFDARPPGDNPDRLVDDTGLQSGLGGLYIVDGVSGPVNQQPGSISPQPFTETVSFAYGELATEEEAVIETEDGFAIAVTDLGTPVGPDVLADDITFITGPVASPSNEA